jgi:tetratricopeptide (TPR) repeat protein
MARLVSGKRTKGDVDAALKLHEEAIAIYEELGDRRSRAVTLGDIARIRTIKGDVDAALAMQNERLAVNRGLDDLDGVAAAQFDIGRIQLSRATQQKDVAAFRAAFDALTESYAILERIGRLAGICTVGMVLARVFALAGQNEEARKIAERSRDGYRRLGRAAQAAQAETLLRDLPE